LSLSREIEPSAESYDHWFEPIAKHLGRTYLRYSFTKGTTQEVDALEEWLQLPDGARILDVGCGPGRHSHEFARRGYVVHGIDISETFIRLATESAPANATFERMDARSMSYDGQFDAVVCLCQGAFGLMTASDDDQDVFRRMARALVPGGRLALSAFNAYFAVKYHEEATFDAATGVSYERTEVRNDNGETREVDLWTGCYTPRELRLMCEAVGMSVDAIHSVEPGGYQASAPTVESPEYLLIASNPLIQRLSA
jgi:SAM-dependent methyltransferase